MEQREWGKLTWKEFDELRPNVTVAVLPIGAIEEHGHHLPLNTDNVAAEEFARLVSLKTRTMLLPTMPYGQVWSLHNFPGSLSISNETLKRFIFDLCMSLRSQNIKGLVVINGHLGNGQALKEAAREAHDRLNFRVMTLFYPGLNKVSGQVMESSQSHPSIMHADEIETSILLSLCPEIVNMDLATKEYPTYPAEFDYVPITWDTISRSGVFGDATLASKTKGDFIMSHVLPYTVHLVETFILSVQSS